MQRRRRASCYPARGCLFRVSRAREEQDTAIESDYEYGMIRGRNSADGVAPFFQRKREEGTPVRPLVWLAAGLVACVFVSVLLQNNATPLVLGLFTFFAMIGVAALVFSAAGFLQFGLRTASSAPDLTRLYAENASRGIAITSKDGSTLFSNEAYQHLVKSPDTSPFSVESALVRHFGGSEPLFRLIRASRRGETAHEHFQALGAPGAGRWIRASVRRVAVTHDGDPKGWVCLWEMNDVTEQVESETQLTQKLQDLRKLLDQAPIGVFVSSSEGRVSFANALLRDWADIGDPDKDTGLHLSAFFPDQAENILTPPAERARSRTLNFEMVKRDGTASPVSVLLIWQDHGNDQENSIVGTVLERHAAVSPDDAPQSELDSLFVLLKSAPIAIAAVAKDGRVTRSNPAFTKFVGSGNDRGAINLSELVDDATREKLTQAVEKARARKVSIPPVDISTTEGRHTGRLFFTPVLETPPTDDAALVFGIDISEQRSLEEQIAQGQKMQAIGQLAGGIAHDFNNVLTAIIGFSDLLLANHRPSDPSFADIMNIKNNANRAAGLVRQMLAFSRKQTLRPQVMSLTDALEDLMILLDQLLGEKVKARVIHGRDLWPIKVDPTQFQQVIINLAVNARDAMPGGGELTFRTANVSERESVKLGHAVMQPGEYVMCEVSDTGSGIPPEVMRKIFEPFFSTKEVGKGTGLGLSTVYGIVKQTGGFIFAESEVGSGTIFRIYLPRCEDEVAIAEAQAEKPAKKEPARDLTGSATVLLVEDEDAVRSFAVRALRTRGYKVLEAISGVDALEVMKEHGADVDIVVSDVVMPEMDGPTLLKHLRKANPDLKIIFVSGYAEDAFRNNLEEDVKFTFLPKPFSLKKLAAAVKETLEED
jgi:two-component system cell cycle sensor histidine kinase/response regulator CckA